MAAAQNARMNGTKALSPSRNRSCCFFLLLASSVCAASAAEQTRTNSLENYLKKLRYEPVAFEYRKNQPIVEANLGGKSHVFGIDSGCLITLVDIKTASGLKTLSESGVVLDDPFFGSLTNDEIVLVEKLKLGRAEFMNQPAVRRSLDVDFVQRQPEGILGLDFLCRNSCLIDCEAHRLYVRGEKPSKEISNTLGETLLRSGYTNAPLSLDSRGHLLLDAQINAKPVRLIVDTGASDTLLDETEMNRLGLRTYKRTTTGTMIPTDDTHHLVIGLGRVGAHKLRVVKIDKLQIGETQWKDLYVGISDVSAWKNVDDQGVKMFHGMLGPGVMAPQGVLIDFATLKLWFPIKPSARRNGWD
jgi:gag-polyprotein putative aspartyl protease